jgi:hypothetical protein
MFLLCDHPRMIRQAMVTSGALVALVALPLAPAAAAEEGQTLLLDSGRVRCVVSPNNIERGGGPMVACQRTDGLSFAQSVFSAEKHSERMRVAVKLGGGEFYYTQGDVAALGAETVVSDGQTVNLYGWTIQGQGIRTKLIYDASGHGIYINQADINQF